MIDIHDYLKDLILTKNKDYACFFNLNNSNEVISNEYICYFFDNPNYSNNYISFDYADYYKISISDSVGFNVGIGTSSNSSISSNNVIYSNLVGVADITKDVNLIRNDLSNIPINPVYLSCILFALIMPILVGFIHHFFRIGGND